MPVRRAASIRPPLEPEDDEEEPMMIMIEMREDDEELSGPRPPPVRRRPIVKSNPPELYARAGEVDLKAGDDRAIDLDEPRIVIDEDALAPPTGRFDVRGAARDSAPPITTIDVVDDAGSGAVIHDRVVDRDGEPPPVALDSFREDDDDSDTGEIDIVVLDAPKRTAARAPHPDRRAAGGQRAEPRHRDDGGPGRRPRRRHQRRPAAGAARRGHHVRPARRAARPGQRRRHQPAHHRAAAGPRRRRPAPGRSRRR